MSYFKFDRLYYFENDLFVTSILISNLMCVASRMICFVTNTYLCLISNLSVWGNKVLCFETYSFGKSKFELCLIIFCFGTVVSSHASWEEGGFVLCWNCCMCCCPLANKVSLDDRMVKFILDISYKR